MGERIAFQYIFPPNFRKEPQLYIIPKRGEKIMTEGEQ
jgi:hypothetical protein